MGVTTMASKNNNGSLNIGSRSQQSSSHHHHFAKSSNFAGHNYSGDLQTHNSTHQQLHRGSTSNDNYTGNIYHQQSQKQQQQRTSPQGPYITQVTIRDNQNIIQSPNI